MTLDPESELVASNCLDCLHQVHKGWIARGLKIIFSTSRNHKKYPVACRLTASERKLLVERINHHIKCLPTHLYMPQISLKKLHKLPSKAIDISKLVQLILPTSIYGMNKLAQKWIQDTANLLQLLESPQIDMSELELVDKLSWQIYEFMEKNMGLQNCTFQVCNFRNEFHENRYIGCVTRNSKYWIRDQCEIIGSIHLRDWVIHLG